jgi:hypothetical protein
MTKNTMAKRKNSEAMYSIESKRMNISIMHMTNSKNSEAMYSIESKRMNISRMHMTNSKNSEAMHSIESMMQVTDIASEFFEFFMCVLEMFFR